MKIVFNGYNCELSFARYRNNRIANELIDSTDGDSVAMATVNLPEEPLEDDEVFIKGWSENAGIEDVLMSAGVIGPILDAVSTGFVLATKHKLLIKPE